ncbi:MAG: DUF503 domain-containing protein [Calditrichaeota bacterium]|nr:DUF503 domain-containing protein [Calditrichota bacterium]
MIVAVLRVELYIPGSTSLKDKRAVLRSVKDRLSKKFNVSVAETDHQDKWQRAELGFAQVGSDYGFLEQNINKIFNILDNAHDFEVVDHLVEYL